MANREEAKKALDSLINKANLLMYKPIQIAEILYRDRIYMDINLLQLEGYRTKSRKWRDDVSQELVGNKCSSSAKYQDNLFEDNAVPPVLINELGIENRRTGGAVEAYIYQSFIDRHIQFTEALEYCLNANKENFCVKTLIDSFWEKPKLRRSLDKLYEIIVYALFSTLVNAMKLQVQISIKEDAYPLLKEFEEFSKKVMSIDTANPFFVQEAHVYRVGVTNAADSGLDMYSNWGPAIQIKHLTLNVELAESIVGSITSDRIVIVCKDAEKDIIMSLLNQIGWKSRIQSVVTENDLIEWYEKALRGEYADILGNELLGTLCNSIVQEFPSVDEIPEVLRERHYEKIKDSFW